MHGFESGITDVNYETAHTISARPIPRDIRCINALFCAVIQQAFFDMQGIVRSIGLAQSSARTWLLRGNTHFRRICDLAGVDPDVIKRAAWEIHEGKRSIALEERGRKPKGFYGESQRQPHA